MIEKDPATGFPICIRGHVREHRLAEVRNRRAKQRKVGGRHTAKDIAALAEMQGHKCAYCRASFRTAKRQAKHPVEFAQSKGLLL